MGNIQIYDIRINYLKNPCGLDSDVNISYKIKDFKNGDKQKSVNILVSKNNDFSDVIYNKKFNGDINVFYNVKAKFEPVTKYYVKVVVSTSFGDVCEGKTFFVTGKLNEKWKAKWITGRSHPNHNSPKIQEKIEFIRSDKDNLQAQYIRKKIFVKDEVKESYITICGVGYFDLRINNKTITEDVLSTPFTRFDKTVLYLQYDISKYLKKGNNAVTVILGNGWYNCFAEDPWNTRQASWRSKPRMICEIKVNYESGEKETFRSDDTWLAYNLGGPIYFNGIRNGEHYDARKEMPGWRNVSYNEELWDNVEIIRGPGGNIKACEMQPIKVIKKFKAVDMWKTEDGGYVFDFGQNQAGYCTFKFRGKENTEYTMVYSDIKKEDGDIDIGPIGGFIRSHGFQTDKIGRAHV